MTPNLPSNEELQRLLKLHHRPRGPITVDGDALARVKRWTAEQSPGFRFVVKPDQSVELTADELSDALAGFVEDDRIIRQKGRRLALDADSEPTEQLQRQFQRVSGQAWQVLDRRCPRCRSSAIQIESSPRHPGWKIACTHCGGTLRRPKSVC